MTNIETRTVDTYREYQATHPKDRNDILRNPEVAFQALASKAALYRALGRIGFQHTKNVLDVGGGAGGSLVPFMEIGCVASSLTSIDVRPDRAVEGRERFPGVDFRTGDAREMPFPDGAFDVVYASGLFLQITDEKIASSIGRDMRRVCRGHIVIMDWALSRPGAPQVAVTRKRVARIFGTPILFAEAAALAPPIGRPLSKYAPWAYFLVQRIFPLGMKVYAMKV